MLESLLLDLLLEVEGPRHGVLVTSVALDPRDLLANLEATRSDPVATLVHTVRKRIETGPLDAELCKIGQRALWKPFLEGQQQAKVNLANTIVQCDLEVYGSVWDDERHRDGHLIDKVLTILQILLAVKDDKPERPVHFQLAIVLIKLVVAFED